SNRGCDNFEGTVEPSLIESGLERTCVQTTSNAPPQTVPPTAGSSWTGLAANVFSFPVMCMFLLVLLIFGFSVRRIGEPDIWWHLRNAASLLQHHSFPRVDTYSFGAAGAQW